MQVLQLDVISGLSIAILLLVLGFGAGRLRCFLRPAARRRAKKIVERNRAKELARKDTARGQARLAKQEKAKAARTEHVLKVDRALAIQLWILSSTQAAETVRERVKWFAGASTVCLAVTASLLAVAKASNHNLVFAAALFILALYASLLPLAGLAEQMNNSSRLMGQSIVDAPPDASINITFPYVWPRPTYRVMESVALVLLGAGMLFLAAALLK